MNAGEWIALAGVGLTIVGWLIRLERRFGAALTRDEHERICSERNTRAEKSLDALQEQTERRHEENRETMKESRETLQRIETKIDANEERASRTRHDTNESVHALAMEIAVLRSPGVTR